MNLIEPTLSGHAPHASEHFDVLFIGAGLSGIGGACHLATQCPDHCFAILDEQDSFGGTWWTHRYPGIRSDSDLYTLGYRFKPWLGSPIATADEILKYMGEVIEENGLGDHIRYRHKIQSARWSSAEGKWFVEGLVLDTGKAFVLSANFLWMGQGYYRHDGGYTPQWPGMENYRGTLLHSQTWPEDLEVKDKRVLLIGSGATAATLLPALAPSCAHVTMLQRSPTYFRTGRNVDELANLLRSLDLPPMWVHEIVRRKIMLDQKAVVQRAFDEPDALRADLLDGVRKELGQEMVDQHFTPRYPPLRQRLAYVPDGDMFKAIRSGQASVVTDEIEHFEANGVRTKSGRLLEADVVVAATGLDLLVMGGIAFFVDDKPVDFSRTVMYRGTMFTGVPNLMWAFGYFRASWTLRVDLLGDFLCRLLKDMKRRNAAQVTPALRDEDGNMNILPWMEDSNFNPTYLLRAMDRLPRQGDRTPWRHTQDYWIDRVELPTADFDDGTLRFNAAGDHRATEDASNDEARRNVA